MSAPASILIVDDERDIRESLSAHLNQNGFAAHAVADAGEARLRLSDGDIDIVILDVMMPGEDGLSLCRHLRATGETPVILLTALADDTDRIVGLEIGADDYITKPFNPRELIARIKAVLRRTKTGDRSLNNPRRYAFDEWIFDMDQAELIRKGDDVIVSLSSGEAGLLRVFLENPGATLSRDDLMNLTRGRETLPFERSIDNAISRLRRKIEIDPADPRLIKTVWGGGYRLISEVRPL